MTGEFRFSFGPWNLHEGADPFGRAVRRSLPLRRKLELCKELGFDGVQFHDDDVVPGLDDLPPAAIGREAAEVRRILDDLGLAAEFVAPRLWETPLAADGAFTAHSPRVRQYAQDRCRRMLDVAQAVGAGLVVLWLAREGTYLREAKDSREAVARLVAALDDMLARGPGLRFAIEPKPNEPMDQAFVPTAGHAIALAGLTRDPARVGVNVESAHAILAGLDPSDEMGFALAFGKLWTVHLNDQNGPKYDQDRAFGTVDLRRAFNQVRILDEHGYGRQGEFVGLDVKALRTQGEAASTRHLANSRELFLRLLGVWRGLDRETWDGLAAEPDYEALDRFVLDALTGR